MLIENTEMGYVPHGESEPFHSMSSFIEHVSKYLPQCPMPEGEAGRCQVVWCTDVP